MDLFLNLAETLTVTGTVVLSKNILAPVSFVLRGILETHDRTAMKNDLVMTGITSADNREMKKDTDQILWDYHS